MSMSQPLTKQYVESLIKTAQYHHFEGTTLTVCCLTLVNGFAVSGESSCAHPEAFDADKGRELARLEAESNVWAYAAYALREESYRATLS